MKPGISPKYWTPEEHTRLMALVEEKGRNWQVIADELGRTVSAVQTRYFEYREGGGFRKTQREMENAAIAARRRLPPPRSLTAEFFGDPLPGRSALDQRRPQHDVRSISLSGGAR